MIESVLHLFKIHREMVFGNSAVIVEDVLGETPESLYAVHMISAVFVDKGLGMIEPMMFTQAFQGIVAPEGISVIHRSFPGMLPDVGHKLISGDPLYDFRVDSSIPL